ncbi:MAG: aminoglycoside phosphotransferase family protein [Oscillospiraceae bacterium]|jgi:aminoglycoside phosphotransferase (APT) family kinase protein|nr:aminoglycoside phosphotransferase family protein [Oscillospiraceae bacterium]
MLDLEVIGQGATTKIYRDGSTAVKLYVNAPPDEAENEAIRQRMAYDAGLPVPAVFGVRQWEGSAVALDMEYIDGRPLMYPEMGEEALGEAIQTLVRLHRMVHTVSAGGLPRLNDRLARRIRQTPHLEAADKDRLLALSNRLSGGADKLCHGDFHPLNVLYDGGKHWIIDWVDAAAGDPLADVCRTYLLLMQNLPRLAEMYLQAFCKETETEREDVLAWLPVVAAGRLGEKLDNKARAWLLELIKGTGAV